LCRPTALSLGQILPLPHFHDYCGLIVDALLVERGLHDVLVATQAVARQPAVGELELMADGPSGALRKLVAMTPREDKLLVAQPALVPQLAQTEICSKNRDSDQHQARLTVRV
jgi:hypothetical protein